MTARKRSEFARLLFNEQRKRDLTQIEFAGLIGISQPVMSCLLNGKKTVREYKVIAQIAKLTGKSVEEIGRMASNGRGKGSARI
jgi:transcriptional regulator with XRE-family HTH domain